MSNEELLMMAAKAAHGAGLNVRMADEHGYDGDDKINAIVLDDAGEQIVAIWNPRADDGDCARLEAALEIDVVWHDTGVICQAPSKNFFEGGESDSQPYSDHGGDKQAARRMASLKVAAEVGRAMP